MRLLARAAGVTVAMALAPMVLTGTASAGATGHASDDDVARLVVQVRLDTGAPAKTWTLHCDRGGGGSHPDAAKACATMNRIGTAAFHPMPSGMMCTMIYGGPQRATIFGVWRGEHVQATYSRANGCEIRRWDQLAPVLPAVG